MGGYRGALIRVATFLGGIYFVLEFILPHRIGDFQFSLFHDQISSGFLVIGSMAVGLGLINLLLVHGGAIVRLRRGWENSLALLLGLLVMVLVYGADWSHQEAISLEVEKTSRLAAFAELIERDSAANNPTPVAYEQRVAMLRQAGAQRLTIIRPLIQVPPEQLAKPDVRGVVHELSTQITTCHALIDGGGSVAETGKCLSELAVLERKARKHHNDAGVVTLLYKFLYDGLFVSLGSAMFALLGFYIAAAAYRAFRVRSVESGLMMVAATVVILGQIPFGLWLWDGFPALRLWLLEVPSAAAFRAIRIGAAVAGLVLAYRMWFSIESGRFAEVKKP